MNINEAAEHLRRLAQSNPHRSKTGCLRELYVEIEAARKAGFTTEKIVDALNEKGLDISLGTFVTLLHRIRKQLGHVATVTTVSAGYPLNQCASDVQGPKEPNPAAQDGVTGLDENNVSVPAAAPQAGKRVSKGTSETSLDFAEKFAEENQKKTGSGIKLK